MNAIHPSWAFQDRQSFWNHYNYEYSTGDLGTLNWYVDRAFSEYEYATQWDHTLIGGYDPNGWTDQYDLSQVWLEDGEIYDFAAVGADPVALELHDASGDLLLTNDGDNYYGYGHDARIADLVIDTYDLNPWVQADTIVNFKADYTGWHTISVTGAGNVLWTLPSEVSIVGFQHADNLPAPTKPSASTPPVESHTPYLIDNDNNHWDAAVADGNGKVVQAEDAQLYRAYMGTMGRMPDKDGFNWWANQIDQGKHTLLSMAEGFIFSEEFSGYADKNNDDQISNHEFVTHMYEGVFGRTPDKGGYDWWMNELDSGSRTQGEALLDMTQSNEYVEITTETVADYLFV
jgi:hypothetical protein